MASDLHIRVEIAAFAAPPDLATPYATSAVRVDARRHFGMAWTDLGGGSVHLLRREIAAPLLDEALRGLDDASTPAPAAKLRGCFDRLDAAVAALARNERMHLGTSGEAAAVLVDAETTFVITCGFCRVYAGFGSRSAGDLLECITLDETLLSEALAVAPQEAMPSILGKLRATTLGSRGALGPRRPWQVIKHDGLETTFFLCTGVVHGSIPDVVFLPWVREALAQPDLEVAVEALWWRGHEWLVPQEREVSRSHHHYARHAAMTLARVWRKPSIS